MGGRSAGNRGAGNRGAGNRGAGNRGVSDKANCNLPLPSAINFTTIKPSGKHHCIGDI